MDRLRSMEVFARIVEARSFTRVAEDMGISRSTLSDAIRELEDRLGVSLFHRTTRVVRPTVDGETYYRRCLGILADIEDADASVSEARPKGRLRVAVHGTLARHFLLPGLPGFMERNPDIELLLQEGDRLVDLVSEGIDCALRVGEPADSDLIGRKVAELREVTCASPEYLGRFGMPQTVADLDWHEMVGFRSSATGRLMPLEFLTGDQVEERLLPARVVVTAGETLAHCARLGCGIIQKPRYSAEDDLAAGALVEILKDHPPPPSKVFVMYPRERHPSPRVRAFIDWVDMSFRPGGDRA